jgi:hypothetical protein
VSKCFQIIVFEVVHAAYLVFMSQRVRLRGSLSCCFSNSIFTCDRYMLLVTTSRVRILLHSVLCMLLCSRPEIY